MAAASTTPYLLAVSESAPTPTVVHDDRHVTLEDVIDGKDNLQGPHDWRKRLKPVSRQSSREEVASSPEEAPAPDLSGDSPADK